MSDMADLDEIAEDISFQAFDDDCRLLGSLLDECLRSEVGEEFMAKVDRIRVLAQEKVSPSWQEGAQWKGARGCWLVAKASLGDDVADLLKTIHGRRVLCTSPGKIVMLRRRVESQFGAMKDWVDGQVARHPNREGRPFGCVPSGLYDRPRSHPFRKELARDVLFKAEFRGGNPDEVPGAEWTRETLAIGLLAHALLCLSHLVACLDKKLLHSTQEKKTVVALGCAWSDSVQRGRDRRAVLELEGRYPNSRVDGRVVGQLVIRQSLNPVFLVGADESAKENLCGLMRPLRLAIGLRVAS
ncbi:hypothetical protein CBR_g51455 [Chara braunii]|uniref:Uncharacterized protein n=1 Tax=Chara braunii TaxID=69332 RepID=A0A388K6K0_CHABU|nr:hypothetical protein CBR_g51455 [Chara braunii]|eukprot:GBG65573.1 hypothetical protein CBR_g51455 [Chara braunii]